MIIVSDASPLHYLVLIQHVDVLPELFREIVTPRVVLEELRHPRAPESVREWAGNPPGWLQVRDPIAVDPDLQLDPGEVAALALAVELRADGILIDERKGRMIASGLNLQTYGTLSVLAMAADRRLLNLALAMEKLCKTTFRIDPKLLKILLSRPN